MEKLGHLIESSIEERSWEPIMLSCRGLSISDLFIADDRLLFAREIVKGADCLRQVLDKFCWFFGHKVNRRKTQLFF